ncbi:MAG: hypothetical protein JW900_01355 [Anaerolineae bacterium]|nr:hypothetical protein [Anaerolineae bacterium]
MGNTPASRDLPLGNRLLQLGTLVLVALLLAAPLWGPGIVNTRGGGDSPFLLQRVHQMAVNLRGGIFPVRWMPDAAYGLGYPFFSYYAALPYYLAGLLTLLGIDILTAIKLTQTAGLIAASLAMYGWTKDLLPNRWAAWLAAVAYAAAPFHLVNLYVRGDSLSEFYAFVFYPLILWAIDRLYSIHQAGATSRSPLHNRIAAAALAYAALVLTHNISALIFTPFVILYALLPLLRKGEARLGAARGLALALVACLLGLLLSAWFWLPALGEMGRVQVATVTEGYFHYERHFRASNLVQPCFAFDYSVAPDLTGRSPFAMGLPQALLTALGGLLLLGRGLKGRLDVRGWFLLVGLLVATAMMTPLSRPLWVHLPLLSKVQFPWRFLSVQALFAAATTAALVPPASAGRKWRLVLPALSLVLAAVLIAAALLSLHPDRLLVRPADVTAERLQLYELFSGNIGSTIRYEYLDQSVVPRPFTSDALLAPGAPPRAIPLDGAVVAAELLEQAPTRQAWRVSGGGGAIAFPLLYWPGWQARVDGQPAAVWPVEGSGYLALQVPPGDHDVVLRLGRTPLRAAAELLSLAAALTLAAVLLAGFVAWRKNWRRGGVVLAAGLLAVGLFPAPASVVRSPPVSAPLNLSMDFEQLPYLHPSPGGIEFAGQVRLVSYRLSAAELHPGDSLAVELEWAGGEEGALRAVLRLVSPAAVRYEVESLVESAVVLSPGRSAVSLALPPHTPRGLYLLQLRLFDPQGELFALTPAGQSRGVLYLQPLYVLRGPDLPADAPLLAPFGADVLLHQARVSQPAADRLALRLSWSAARPLAANYGISLRLLDAGDQLVTALDTQPGYGFLPTSLWQPGELVEDRYLLALPGDLLPGSYHLQVILYQVPTLAPVGQARVGDFDLPLAGGTFEARPPDRSFVLPALEAPTNVDFGGELRLLGCEVDRDDQALRLTLWWQALAVPQADYTLFVHLFDPQAEEILLQHDAPLQGDGYPTSWWVAGQVVGEVVAFPVAEVPAGAYRLAVGLYDRAATRLPAVGPDGVRIPDARLVLPVAVDLAPGR